MHACHDLCAADNIRQYKRHPLSNGQGFQGPPALDHLLDQHCSIPIRPQACERLLSACSTPCRQPPASCNKITGWTRAALAGVEGLRPLTYVYALPLHIYSETCIALHVRLFSTVGRSMSQARHAGAKPHKEREKKSGHGNGLRTLLRTFVRI
jgi:hypothetical protein